MKKPKKNKQQQPARPDGRKPPESKTEFVTAAQTPAPAPGLETPDALGKEAVGEPWAARAPVPVLLIALLAGLLFWGDMYIVDHGGELDARVYQPYLSFKQIEDFQPKGEEEILRAKGLKVYTSICSGCHQADGSGSAAQFAPPLAGSEWVIAKDPARIIRIVLHGLSGPITVKDKEYGAGAMVAWGPVLSDEDIAHVLTYARISWGNKAPAVSVDQVKSIRAETKDHSGYMTVPDLNKVTLKD
jgi:mono/diheme cytochrome c family protein